MAAATSCIPMASHIHGTNPGSIDRGASAPQTDSGGTAMAECVDFLKVSHARRKRFSSNEAVTMAQGVYGLWLMS